MHTALHYASFCGYTEAVDLLLQSNADPNIYNNVSVYCVYFVFCLLSLLHVHIRSTT